MLCRLLSLFTAVALVTVSAASAAAERIAMVIGNSNYTDIQPLANPRNDAADIAERLQALGFELYGERVFYDLDERRLLDETDRFADAADAAEIHCYSFLLDRLQANFHESAKSI